MKKPTAAVLLHGWAHTPASMQQLADCLPESWTKIIPDLNSLPGNNRESLHAMLQQTGEEHGVILIGWSLGWLYALDFAGFSGIKGGIALAALPCFTVQGGISSGTLRRIALGLKKNRARTLDQFNNWVGSFGTVQRSSAPDPVLLSGLELLQNADHSATQPVFPVHYILAQQDEVLPAAAAAAFSGLPVSFVQGTHGFFMDAPGDIARMITDWVENLPA